MKKIQWDVITGVYEVDEFDEFAEILEFDSNREAYTTIFMCPRYTTGGSVVSDEVYDFIKKEYGIN